MLRELVPAKFKPDKQPEKPRAQIDFKAGQPSPALYSKDQKPSVEPQLSNPSLERPAAFNFKSAAEKPAQERVAKTLTLNFQAKVIIPADTPQDKAKAPEWKQPMPIRIVAMEKAIQERRHQNNPPSKTMVELSERKNWFTHATEKTQPLQKIIDKTIAERKTAEAKPSSIREQFKKPDTAPVKIVRTTNEIEIDKIKQEAEKARSRVPAQYRAEPYDSQPPDELKPAAIKEEENTFQSAFKEKAENFGEQKTDTEQNLATEKSETEIPPRPKMSQGFNAASFNGVHEQKIATPDLLAGNEISPDLPT